MAGLILIVDDESDIVATAKMILEADGYHVTTATNGDEALAKTDSEVPDLILLDVVMTGKSGLEVCKILKTQAKTRHIPVVLFTALGRDVDRKLGAEAGADGHFTKPFTPEGLLVEVKKHLDRARADRFSRQLGVSHDKLRGNKLLLEFDPTTPYERLVRDFAMECVAHNESVLVLTKKGSAVRQALESEKEVELIDMTPDLILSPILEKHSGQLLSLVYDSLTDLALSTNPSIAYKFAGNAIERLTPPTMTALFLLNPTAHEQRDVYSLKGVFSSQVVYGKQGVTSVKIA